MPKTFIQRLLARANETIPTFEDDAMLDLENELVAATYQEPLAIEVAHTAVTESLRALTVKQKILRLQIEVYTEELRQVDVAIRAENAKLDILAPELQPVAIPAANVIPIANT